VSTNYDADPSDPDSATLVRTKKRLDSKANVKEGEREEDEEIEKIAKLEILFFSCS
jgi:hypothetical protein